MGSDFRLGSVLGFEIRIDYSWFVIFFLILWSLSSAFFPGSVEGLSGGTYLVMGVAGTLLFFASLLAHELSHSVVARSKGIPVEGITLFIFGGMARTRMESESPDDELAIAGVGPLMSVVLGAMFFGLEWLGIRLGAGPALTEVAHYLGFINLLLAGFNLLPGFPLDGGRLFRALVWRATGNPTKATRWASNGGVALGYVLMALGFLQAFAGAVLGGLWLVFIGWFLRSAAASSFQQFMLRRVLEGVPAREIMSAEPVTVRSDLTLQELVDDHFLRRRFQCFPVVDDGRIRGLVTLDDVKEVSRDAWTRTRISEVMTPVGDELLARPDEPMTEVLTRMRDSGTRRVLVVAGGVLQGIVSASDVAGWAQRVQELGGPLGR